MQNGSRATRDGAALCLAACLSMPSAFAADVLFHGKVTMEDGSPPAKPVTIERMCVDMAEPAREALTNAKGEFIWRVQVEGTTLMTFNRTCVLRASSKNNYSTTIDLSNVTWFSDPILPPIVLLNRAAQTGFDAFSETRVPRAASKAWQKATAAAQSRNWKDADFQLRVAVKIDPKFAQGWHALGITSEQLGDLEHAREAQRRAVELNPKLLPALVMLGRLDLESKDWPSALKTTGALISSDTRKRHPEAYLQRAMAQFYSHNLDEAEASALECIRADRSHDLPRAEIVLGLILEQKHNLEAAREHLDRYLTIAPRASDAAFVRSRVEHLGQPDDHVDAMKEMIARIQPAATGEAWIPGGMKALSAIAFTSPGSNSENFFENYCSALVREGSPGMASGLPGYRTRLNLYMSTFAELTHSGEHRDGKTILTLSLDEQHRKETEHVLGLFGWKVTKSGIEIGDTREDSPRQDLLAPLGVDPIAMQKALESGQSFALEIPSDNARLVGGDAWGALIKDLPSYPGGIADAFAHDHRLAKACAGLHAMSADASRALLSGIGLPTLVTKFFDPLARYGPTFAISGEEAATPGSEDAWQKLAGASPRKPAAFFRAVLERDEGALAAFYFALSQTDGAHQKYFTSTPQRAEKFYTWYRDSGEPRWSQVIEQERWRTRLFRSLPLDDSGNLRYPGARSAWTNAQGSDDDILLKLPALRALVHIAELEQKRGTHFDAKSAALLAQFDAQWYPLYPYFEQLKEVGADELEALAGFTQAAAKLPGARQNAVLGEWYSLVELISRGAKAGSLDPATSARAFRNACQSLTGIDHGAKAIALAHELGGVDLLRFPPDRRAAYDRVLAEQNVPRVEDPGKAALALSGMVYAATLDPDGLLAGWDPALLAKHRFAIGDTLFAPSKLERSSQPPGSYFAGGFMGFAETAAKLARAGGAAEPTRAGPSSDGAPASSLVPETDSAPADAVFRASGRLVEVFATVTDSRGRYIDDLRADQFTVAEQGTTQPILGFESRSSEVSVALLLDTTASMEAALPSVKNAALKLISELREADSVAVYSFAQSVNELQSFTTDKEAAKRAVVRTGPMGETALYDALARVNRDLSGRTGKKVIVVFTDGEDNMSTLTAQIAIQRAKGAGIPVYTIAQGAAVTHRELLDQLAEVSKATGGSAFVIRNTLEVRAVFEKISQDLQHGYFFLFQPAAANDHEWRSIDVKVKASGSWKVRAREGFYPE